MHPTHLTVLPPGHPARRATLIAVLSTLLGTVLFTVFALFSTQVRAIRSGSPWQNDPWDGMVSFTELLVPAVAVLIVARLALWRPAAPQPVARADQLLRAARVSALLIAATAVTDGLALVAHAERSRWNHYTVWLAASLLPVTGVAVAAVLAARRATRDLPSSRTGPDWLEDLGVLVVTLARPLPRPVRRAAIRVVGGPAIDLVRRHIMLFAAAASLLTSVTTTIVWAVSDDVADPLLISIVVANGSCGFWAFCFFANRVLRIATPSVAARPLASRAPLVAACITVPVSAVTRDQLWGLTGLGGSVDSPSEFAAVIAGTVAMVAGTVFIASRLRRSSARA